MLALNSRPPMLGVPTSTPVVRRDTLLGRALQNVVLPGVQVMDLGERVFASSGATSGTLKPGPTGPARNYTGLPAASQIVPVRGASSYPFVHVWAGRFNAGGSGPKPFKMIRSASGGSGDLFEFTYLTSTQVGHNVRNNFSSTSSAIVSVPGGATLGVDLVVIAQVLSATDHRIYCNGVMATDATNASTPASAFNQMWLCSSGGNNDHDTYLAAFGAGVALPDAYALELSRTPAKLFGELLQQPRRRLWSITPPTGGSDTAITVADAAHAHAADAITLASASDLAVADSAHAHTSEAPALSADTSISVQDQAHAHTDGGPLDLSGVPSLAVDAVAHGHTSDAITLSSESLLAIADALHGHTSTSVVLVLPSAAYLLTEPFKDWDGNLLALATIPGVVVLDPATRAVLLSLADQVTQADARLRLEDSALPTGQPVVVVSFNADGSARGIDTYTVQ